MLRSIQLKLSRVKYGGSPIGRDIRIEIKAFAKLFTVDKRIDSGETKEINEGMGSIETDKESLQSDIFITVTEKDLLFDDVGSATGNIKVDATSTKPQQFVFTVEVKERRSLLSKLFWGGRKAVFEITLEAEVSDAIRYVPDEDGGWLKVIMEDKNSEQSLPAYLKVNIERTDNTREYFTILEGAHRGRPASVELRDDGSSWLMIGITHEPPARIIYSISKKTLTLKGKKYKADDDPENPWRRGLYDIEIPDHPHEGGLKYPEAGRGTVWFKIGHGGERYAHPGLVSAGCISITETVRWMEIYDALIKARKGDFMSVGALEVID
jgi:hypothetical protein